MRLTEKHISSKNEELSGNGWNALYESLFGSVSDSEVPAPTNDQITADSTPKYNFPFWPLDEAWHCRDWMLWHKKLKEKYGQEKAEEIFLSAWEDQYPFQWEYSMCKYRDDFADYFESQGMDADNILSAIYRHGTDTVENVSKGVEGISAGIGNITLGKLLIAAGFVGAGYYVAPAVQNKIKEWTE